MTAQHKLHLLIKLAEAARDYVRTPPPKSYGDTSQFEALSKVVDEVFGREIDPEDIPLDIGDMR